MLKNYLHLNIEFFWKYDNSLKSSNFTTFSNTLNTNARGNDLSKSIVPKFLKIKTFSSDFYLFTIYFYLSCYQTGL